MHPSLWHVTTKRSYDLAMLFLRSQEFYESPKFKGKHFTILEFMDWYTTTSENDTFSYNQDWQGFNVPSLAIHRALYDAPDYNHWDMKMYEIYGTIIRDFCASNFYLIGSVKGDTVAMDHEIAHGLFYLNQEYKKTMKKLVSGIPCRDKLFEALATGMGYARDVLHDEAQAYLATGLVGRDLKAFQKYTPPFVETFNKFNECASK